MMDQTIQPIQSQEQQGVTPKQEEHKREDQSVDPFLLACLMLAQSVQINHESAALEAKQIQASSASQNELISEQAAFALLTVSNPHISQDALYKLENENQLVLAERAILQNKMTVAQQNVSIYMAQLSTVLNENTQTRSQNTALQQMMVSMTNQISQI